MDSTWVGSISLCTYYYHVCILPVDKDYDGDDKGDIWYEDGGQNGGDCLWPGMVMV